MTKSLFRQLTIIIWAIQIFVLMNCGSNKQPSVQLERQYSTTQRYLFKLLADYKADYLAATNKSDRENIQAEYQEKMQRFLVDSLERYIDSITVIVDTVIREGWLVTTQFHTGDIEFKYGMRFQDSMPPSFATLYKFMTDLSPGKEVTVDFIHLGGGELNYPDDKIKRTMRIFAYPEPIKTSK